jgi:Fe-S-cluster containining protein
MSGPWYQEGLRFRCTRCGHCCTGTPGYVWVNDQELAAIAAFLDEPPAQTRAVYTYQADRGRSLREQGNGDCVFYDRSRGCTIYPVRPRQCRTWPFWESNVATPEAWEQTCRVCPGSGQGELISAEEITRRLKVIKL